MTCYINNIDFYDYDEQKPKRKTFIYNIKKPMLEELIEEEENLMKGGE